VIKERWSAYTCGRLVETLKRTIKFIYIYICQSIEGELTDQALGRGHLMHLHPILFALQPVNYDFDLISVKFVGCALVHQQVCS
jgi:hypothetical protein